MLKKHWSISWTSFLWATEPNKNKSSDQAFRGYAVSHKVEIIERKYAIVQLEAIISSIKDLFSDLLNETKGFQVFKFYTWLMFGLIKDLAGRSNQWVSIH